MFMRMFIGVALAAGITVQPLLAAQTTSGDVFIQAVRTVINFKTGLREHRGKVVVVHGNVRLNAHKLTEYRQGSKLIRVIAEGNPVRFEQSPPYTAQIKTGEAQRAEYWPVQGTLKLWDYQVQEISGARMRGEKAMYVFDKP